MKLVLGIILGIYIIGIFKTLSFFNEKEKEHEVNPTPFIEKLGEAALWPWVLITVLWDFIITLYEIF